MSEVQGPPAVDRRRFPRRWRRARRALAGLLVLAVLGIVGHLAFWRIGPPLLSRISPSPAHVGDTVTLDGQGFDTALEGNVVYFGDYTGRLMRAERTTLVVEVPDIGVPAGGEQGVKVKVQVDEDKLSNALDLVVLPSLDPEPGTEVLTEDEEAGPLLDGPNPGYASPSPSSPPSLR
ncbi:MAG TPA: IPT/TIG domain-containing protein [Vicinamibacteria bacterium]|nr:IPT/TIG domain-containing protein [Vicinamibacteria bacterium]